MAVLKVWTSAIAISIGAFIFGFDTGSIGSLTIMSQFTRDIGVLSAIMRGLVVSIILVPAVVTGFVAGGVSDRISRLYTIAIGAALFAAGSVICATSFKLSSLLVGRVLSGCGEGFFLSLVAVYSCEISPKESRGRIGSVIQLGVVIGITSGFFVCYGTVQLASSMAWRLPFIIQAILSTIYLVTTLFFLDFSPAWLHYKGRLAEADAVLVKLSKPGAEVEKEEVIAMGSRTHASFSDLLHKDVRGRTALAVFLMTMQQLSGIDGILYYAPTLFKQAGISGETGVFLASGVSGIVQVATTAACLGFMDRLGRRSSTIVGGAVMSGIMLLIGTLYATAGANAAAGKWVIIVCLYVFIVAFCSTWALTMRIYATEVQPLRTRAAVSSIATSANQCVNFLIALTTPLFLEKTNSGPYFMFSACLLLTVVVAFTYMPETAGRSFASIDGAFRNKTSSLHALKLKTRLGSAS